MSLFLENIYADKYLREIIRNVASGDSDTWIGFSKHIGRIVAFPLEVIKFTVYIHTSYAMLSSGITWNMPRVTCIFRIHTSLYPMPNYDLRKSYGNFRKLRKRFKSVIEELYTKKIYENFENSLAIFGNV